MLKNTVVGASVRETPSLRGLVRYEKISTPDVPVSSVGICAAVFACAAMVLLVGACGVPRAWTVWVLSTRLSCSSGRSTSRVRLPSCAGFAFPIRTWLVRRFHFIFGDVDIFG